MERIGIVGPGAADEKLARVGSCSEVSVVESAGVNVHIGCGVAPAAQTDVSPHQAGEVLVIWATTALAPVVPSLPEKAKTLPRRTVQNDGIRDAE